MNLGKVASVVKMKASTIAGEKGVLLKGHMPKILLVAGIGLEVGAIVAAIVASRKSDALLEDHEERLEMVKAEYVEVEETVVNDQNEEVTQVKTVKKTPKEIRRGVRRCYGLTLWKGVKLYGPTGLLLALSTACFVCMHNIQAGEIAGLSGAYMGLKTVFDEYQQRNIELNGEESHRMCKYGYKEVEVREEDPDTGEEIIEKRKVVNDVDDIASLPFHDQFYSYRRQTSKFFSGANIIDKNHLQCVENQLYDIVNARGYAVVNDALDLLGIDRPLENPGTMVEGWVKGCGPKPSLGYDDAVNRNFLIGKGYTEVLLDMNIHGNVYSLIKKKHENEAMARAELLARKASGIEG